ncbi:hypothetical protein ACQ4PT_062127 [Festuca glaucescens]
MAAEIGTGVDGEGCSSSCLASEGAGPRTLAALYARGRHFVERREATVMLAVAFDDAVTGELLEAGSDTSDRVKNKRAENPIDNVVIEELEVPSGINKSGRKRGSKPKYNQAIQKLEPSSSVKEFRKMGCIQEMRLKIFPLFEWYMNLV